MLYRDYCDKLAKRRRIFDCVWRFRALVLLGILLILAAAGALLGVKGIVYGEVFPEELEYGRPVCASAKSVFGKASFEYRLAGTEEWQSGEPVAAGEYEVRAVAKTVVGTWRRGGTHTLKILPAAAEVRVLNEELVYGEKPQFAAGLKYDDILRVDAYSAIKTADGLKVSADAASVKILNSAGLDVTNSYVFNVSESIIRELPRPLTVKTPSQTFMYDGAPHEDINIEIVSKTGLAEGDYIEELEMPSPVAAGDYKNTVDYISIKNRDGEVVTGRYKLEYEEGMLTVQRRPVTVKTLSDDFVYDGRPRAYSTVTVSEGGLAENEQITVPGTGNSFIYANEDGYVNDVPFDITDSYGNSVKSNYEISYDYGTVIVRRRSAEIVAAGKQYEYNHTLQGFEAGDYSVSAAGDGLALTDGLVVKVPFAAVNAGVYQNKPVYSVVSLADGADVTDNYIFTEDLGALEILKRQITVQTESGGFTYDAAPHSVKSFTVILETPLVAGHELIPVYPEFIDAGEHKNDPGGNYKIYSADGADVTVNYSVTWDAGTVDIARRPLSVTSQGGEWEYDGKPHAGGSPMFGNLAAGHRAGYDLAVNPPEITEVGQTENRFEFRRWDVYDGNGAIVTSNYQLPEENIEYGVLKIYARNITLSTATESFVYDGKTHAADQVTAQNIAEGHRLEHSSSLPLPSLKEVGELENKFNFEWHIFDGNDRDVTRNYALSGEITYGTISVTLRTVVMSALPVDVVYDAKPHCPQGYTVLTGAVQFETYSLAEGHYAELTYKPLTDAGMYGNVGPEKISIYDEEGNDVSENYHVIWEFCTVNIQKRPITVHSPLFEKIYDGSDVLRDFGGSFEIEYYENDTLNHIVKIKVPIEAVNAGTYDFVVEAEIFDENDDDVTKNYEITYKFGKVLVQKRELIIETGSSDFVYDAAPHGNSNYNFAPGSLLLVEGHELSAEFDYFVPAGSFRNSMKNISVTDGSKNDVTDNYLITQIYGTIYIARRPLYAATPDGEWEYDGEKHVATSITFENLVKGHRAEYGLVVDPPEITEVGQTENRFEFRRWEVYDGNGAIVTSNYQLPEENITYGNLKVYPRNITLSTATESFVYDGQTHVADEVTAQNIVAGHRLEHSSSLPLPSLKEVGELENKFDFEWHIFDGNNRDVTRNYALSGEITYGTISVLRRPVLLHTYDSEEIYDASEHSARGYFCDGSKYDLVDGHYINADYPSFIDAGEYPNVPSGDFNVYDEEGNDVTKNYEIEWTYGTINIKRRPMKVITPECAWRYDGQNWLNRFPIEVEYYNGSKDKYALSDGEVFKDELGHIVRIEITTDVVEAGNYPFTCEATVYDVADNDVTKNYEITYEFGTILLSVRKVEILTGSDNFMYDGQGHSADSFTEINDIAIAVGQTLIPEYPEFVDAGYHENRIEEWKVYSASGEDVSKNYEIIWQFGTVRINPRPVTVSTGDDEWVYDGTIHGDAGGLTVDYGEYPSLGHTFERSKPFTEVNAGEYTNLCEVTVWENTDGASRDVTANYDITYGRFGHISIRKRHAKIITESKTWVYDKNYIESGGSYIAANISEVAVPDLDGGLLEGHTVSGGFTELKAITDSDTEVLFVDNRLNSPKVLSAEGLDCTDNYEIECEWGKLRVKSPVEVYIYTISKQYDGLPLGFTDGDYFIEKLPPDVQREQVVVRLNGSLLTPKTMSLSDVYAESEHYVDCEGENRVDFVGNEIVLEITPRVLRIATASIEAVMGDEPLYGNDTPSAPYWICYGTLLSGHKIDPSVEVTGVLMPGGDPVENTLSEVKIYDADGNNVTLYYEIQYEYGVLSWK